MSDTKKPDRSSMCGRIMAALKRRHARKFNQMRKWAYFDEFPMNVKTGEKTFYGNNRWNVRRIDGYAICLWGGEHYRSISYEIKVHIQDFKAELADPSKRKGSIQLTNQFFFVAPKDMIPKKMIPKECGLMEYSRGRLRISKQAPHTDCEKPSLNMIMAMVYRIDQKSDAGEEPKQNHPQCLSCESVDIYWRNFTEGTCRDCNDKLHLVTGWVPPVSTPATQELFNVVIPARPPNLPPMVQLGECCRPTSIECHYDEPFHPHGM